MTEYRTECDGWAAVWRMDQARIQMMHVGATVPGRPPLMAVDAPAAAPDLVIARELFPGLSRLWDAVRNDYWRHIVGPRAGSTP
ncbi:hypothetical protein [Nocardia cyriacigeorgica]|uniref:hypothetical protein n=1 Tax=Nocardia cyriacigeorgica TaxID=135487 RepID=UPI0018957228|nr:hypothetical protein [Nocardia cyriacigeorgica]MBF6202121.1 hypothetical protein [Nocardia cyriacigeorgica]